MQSSTREGVWVTWEGGGWWRCGHSDGDAHTAAATILSAAASTAAAGVTAPTAPAVKT